MGSSWKYDPNKFLKIQYLEKMLKMQISCTFKNPFDYKSLIHEKCLD